MGVTGERSIRIIGGGLAGSAAAIAGRGYGAKVQVVEKSRTAHHKVCGEFIAAEACQVLEELGVWNDFMDLRPARSTRCCLRFGSRLKQWKLAGPAYGLSRLELDRLLLNRAAACGAQITRGERWQGAEPGADAALILATGRARAASETGRAGAAPQTGRLFGFKTHFDGPTDDAVELFFGRSSYIGVSTVENGITNVCGIAPEAQLRRYGFQFDDFVFSCVGLADRLKPLKRRMPWLSTGPLSFSGITGGSVTSYYPAGDALAFVDPFTGSGILNALLTGRMAGIAAAEGLTPEVYLGRCRSLLRRPFTVSAILRTLLKYGCAESLAAFVPGAWIYRFTRAAIADSV